MDASFDREQACRVLSGEYAVDRLPPEVEREGEEGPLRAATEIALRSHGTIRPDQGREYAQIQNRAQRQAAINALNRILRPLEERNLRHWAEEHGLMLEAQEFAQEWREQGEQGETEHEIYFDDESQRWFKRNNLGASQFLSRHLPRGIPKGFS